MNQRELELDRWRRIRRRFMAFLVVWPVISLVGAFLPDMTALQHGQTSFGLAEFAERLVVLLAAGFLGALVIFGVMILGRRSRRTGVTTVLCDRCGAVKRYDDHSRCDCGGTFVNIEQMKWVQDQSSEDSHRPAGSEGE